MPRCTVWLIGDLDERDFAPAVDFLRRETLLHTFASTGETGEYAGPEPDLILLAAARPGRFAAAQIEELHSRVPLARLVALLGTWCEGEVRSGRPWPGVTRIYAHQWEPRLRSEILELSDHGKSPFWQPRTANEADRLMSTAKNLPPANRQLIGIVAARRTMFEALSGACDGMGHPAVWLVPSLPPPVQHVDAVVCDATLDLTTELTTLASLREQLQNPPAILLLDFPRPTDLTQAMNAGVSVVLAKPYLLSDLAAEIERVTVTATAVAKRRTVAA